MNATHIYADNGTLTFVAGDPATKNEYELADRCIGSIFEALEPGEFVFLKEGIFVLDEDLDLKNTFLQPSCLTEID